MDVHGRRVGLIAVLACWMSAIVLGKVVVLDEASKPGLRRPAVEILPEPERTRSIGRTTLVMFAHPLCPCTPASLTRVGELLAAAPASVEATVFFDIPDGVTAAWEHGESERIAESIPRLRVVADPNGDTARRFGVSTSGGVLIFDPEGRRIFQGGLTARRGDPSENAASDAALACLRGRTGEPDDWPVFGCSLFGETEPSSPSPPIAVTPR